MADASPVRIGLCGLGSIGRQAGRLLLDHRIGFELVGAATKEDDAIGRRVSEVVGSTRELKLDVVSELSDVLSNDPDVVIYSTGSFLDDTIDDILQVASAGANLVSPCEELAFPFNRRSDLAQRIDQAARANDVTILGTGVNPGFIFDLLVATISGVCWDVGAIRGRRVVDVAGFGENIHRRLGIGYTSEEFERGHEQDTIAGHVGFPESVELVCERLGLTLDEPVVEVFEPLLAASDAPTSYGKVSAGRTEGFIQRATAMVEGQSLIQLELVLHLRPRAAGFEPADTVEIDGIHPVRLTLSPGMDAILATSAELVNGIPTVLNAPAGLKSVKDLPATAAWVGDLRARLLR
jgi:4-hydroxy-tetrahydrodipicolinate reductase